MHEMSYITKVVDLVSEEVEQYAHPHVKQVEIAVGEMTGAVEELLQSCYREAIAGTPLAGSLLLIEPVPVLAECGDCHRAYHPERTHDYRCPHCRSLQSRIIDGRDVVVKNIRLD